jgi:hypothetical protein
VPEARLIGVADYTFDVHTLRGPTNAEAAVMQLVANYTIAPSFVGLRGVRANLRQVVTLDVERRA